MDVLVRMLNGKPYVWEKAKFTDGSIKVGDITVHESDIVSIRNDIRKKYVKCNVCGKYFKKGSKKIDQHKEIIDNTRKCFGCEYLRQSVKKQQSQKYELLENGNYMSKTKSEVFLYCASSYGQSINSQVSKERCKHNMCHNATMVEESTFLMQHPGAFDDIITIDKIVKCGYKEIYNGTRGLTVYQLKAKNTISANVNALNIVESFNVEYRGKAWLVYYSKKYDELYTPNYGAYIRWTPYGVNSNVRERIKAKISSLYI